MHSVNRQLGFPPMGLLLSMLITGCGVGGSGGTTAGGASRTDFTRPTVTGMSPSDDTFGIATNVRLTATFSEAMLPAEINAANFRLTNQDTAIPGTVTFDAINHIAVFAPTTALAPNTRYTATVVTGIRDLSDNPLTADFAWCFTTAAADDTSAPSLLATFPENAAVGVPTNHRLTASFSEEIDTSTLTTANFTLAGATAAPVSGKVTYIGRTAIFTPTQALTPNSTYSATITTGVRDLAGNALTSNGSWNFKTGAGPDLAAPIIVSTKPVSAETGVGIGSTIDITFNEPMDPNTITTANFVVQGPDGNPLVGTVAFDAASNTAIFTRINHLSTPVTFHATPVSNLDPNTTYTAMLTTGVKDLGGNALATSQVWSFTTGS